MNRSELMNVVEGRAASIAKKVAKTAAQAEAARFEQMAASPTAKVWVGKFQYIKKQAKITLADAATAQLQLLAQQKKNQNPNLSDQAALVATISEGLARQDMTPPDPVRFLLGIIDDPDSAIISAEQASKIEATRAAWAEHGLAL